MIKWTAPTLAIEFLITYNYMDELIGWIAFGYLFPFPAATRCCDVDCFCNKNLKIMYDIQKKISNICVITVKMNIFVTIT